MLQSYAVLVERFPLTPIQDDAHLDRAIAFLDPLLPQIDDEGVKVYALALGELIEAYEAATIPLGEVTPGEVLAVLMDGRGIGPVELARETEVGIADVAAILDGGRPPTPGEMTSFGKFFVVNASTFGEVADGPPQEMGGPMAG